jgi:uncharacterized protein (TIGR02996 family)
MRGMSTERYATWIEAQVEDHRPSSDHNALDRLAQACAALAREQGMVFGMAYPRGLPRRDAILARALDVLRAWVPNLSDGALRQLEDVVERAELPIDLGARKAELAERRAAELDARIAKSLVADARFGPLERAIVDDPDDLAAYAVLADALQREGDPRGELIALQVAAETDPAKAPHAQRYLKANQAALLGPLAEVRPDAFTWRRGYIHRVRLSADDTGDVLVGTDELELLLRHPAGRFLHEIVVGLMGAPAEDDLSDVIRFLAEHTVPTVRLLHLGDFSYPEECEMSWFEVGDLDELWRALPRLRWLITQGNITASAIEHAALERLEVRTGGLPRDAARAIAQATTPALHHLEVWYGSSGYGAGASIDDVAPLLARRDLPALRHLGLRNCEFVDAIVEALPGSPLLGQLEVLDLSMGTFYDDTARALLAHADAFRHLRRIDVSRSWLGERAIAALRGLGPEIVADHQQGDGMEDHRYVAVGE